MNPIVVQDVHINEDGTGHATLDVYAQIRQLSNFTGSVHFQVSLRDNSRDVVKPLTLLVDPSKFATHNETQKVLVGRMTITNATLWQPRQFGSAKLYDL